jgi:hypothetical protein
MMVYNDVFQDKSSQYLKTENGENFKTAAAQQQPSSWLLKGNEILQARTADENYVRKAQRKAMRMILLMQRMLLLLCLDAIPASLGIYQGSSSIMNNSGRCAIVDKDIILYTLRLSAP